MNERAQACDASLLLMANKLDPSNAASRVGVADGGQLGSSRERGLRNENGPTDEFWKVAKPDSEPLETPWFLPSILVTLLFATPWYLPSKIGMLFWHGLPIWVWVALVGAGVLAALTAFGALALWQDKTGNGVVGEVDRSA